MELSCSESENDVNSVKENENFYTNVFFWSKKPFKSTNPSSPGFKILPNNEPVVLIGEILGPRVFVLTIKIAEYLLPETKSSLNQKGSESV